MMNSTPSASVVLSFVLAGSLGCLLQAKAPQSIKIVSSADWKEHAQEIDGLSVEGGVLHPTGKKGVYRSRIIPFTQKKFGSVHHPFLLSSVG